MKLFSDLKIGDKVFVIHKNRWTFDIAEVIAMNDFLVKFQFYFDNDTLLLWKYYESHHETMNCIIFIDEKEAIEVFKNGFE